MPAGPPTALDLPIRGMHCAACAAKVEKAARSVAGVEGVNVNFATAHAAIGGSPRLADVAGAIEAAGYGVGTTETRLASRARGLADALRAIDGVLEVREE